MNRMIKYAVQTPVIQRQHSVTHSKSHTNKLWHTFQSILMAQAFTSFYLRMVHNLARWQPLLDTEQYFFLDHAYMVRI